MHPLTRNCHQRRGTAFSPLTERETDVLTWIANGKTAWEIGQLLNLSTALSNGMSNGYS